MEGPTSSGGSRNRLICLTLQEHDDDDDDDDENEAITVNTINFYILFYLSYKM